MKNKPIPNGYKILALCDYGYTWSFLPLSRTIGAEVGDDGDGDSEVENIVGLNETSRSVAHLVKELPTSRQAFNIYMDNFFSNIPLFSYYGWTIVT